MNREIKFRAWNKEKGLITNPLAMSTIISRFIREFRPSPTGFGSRAEEVTPDEYKIMQYTGLKDKNGKECYEGDIVRYKKPNWETGTYVPFEIKLPDFWKSIEGDLSDCEIIGNKWENPELLNG